MKIIISIILGVFILSFLLLEFCGLVYGIGDGFPKVKLKIENTAERPRSIHCEAFGLQEQADQAIERMKFDGESMYTGIADPFEGNPVTFRVGISHTTSMCGRTLSRSQYHPGQTHHIPREKQAIIIV